MSVSIKQLRDNQNNFIYPKIAKEGLVEPINSNDVGISAINGIQSSTVQGALNELAGNNVEIVKTVSGNVISVSDSADYRLLGLKLYGKSVQDGAPTPEAPVEIESAGDGGDIGVKIQNKNLIYTASVASKNGVTMTKNEDGTFILNGTVVNANAGLYFVGNYNTTNVTYPDAQYSFKVDGLQESDRLIIRNNSRDEFNARFNAVLSYNGNIAQVGITLIVGHTYDNTIIKPMLIAGENMPDEFIPGIEPQTLTYATPNGLPGIPVESGGNYTDEDGQQWICDEVDFGRGKYVQRIKKEYLTGTPNFNVTADIDAERFRWGSCLTNIYKDGSNLSLSNFATFQRWSTGTSNPPIFAILGKDVYFKPTASTTKEEINALFTQMIASENPPYIVGQLETPVETDLTPEQLAAYAALTTYKPNTTVTTDSSPAAGIEVKYLTDSGVSEVLDYYASKDDLEDKQDKLSGTTGQFVGFNAEGEAEAQEITAANVGAMPTVDGGTTGQYLRKTADGQAWQNGPDLSGYATTADVSEAYAKKALKFTGTFTAAGWTSATGGYSQMINVSGLTADDEPIIDLNSTATDADTFDGQLEAFGLVSNFTTGAGTLTAVVLGDSAPTVDIPIHGVVVY